MRAEQRAEHNEASFDYIIVCFARCIRKKRQKPGRPRKAPAESFGAKGRAEKEQQTEQAPKPKHDAAKGQERKKQNQ
jgi:hypothetical protein